MFRVRIINPARKLRLSMMLVLSLGTAIPCQAAGLDVDGVSLTYEEAGSGDVVLFVHGAVSDHRVWSAFRDRVAERYRFVAYDQRYFGPGDWPDDAKSFSVSTHADDLVGVIDALGGEPVHLVSWSYGGLVGLHAALRHPEKFRSIVHYEPTVEALHAGLSGERAAIAQKFASFGPMAEALQNGSERKAVRRLIEAVFRMENGEADAMPDEVQRMWDDNARTLPPFLAALGAAAAVTCEDLGTLEVPTLVVQGEEAYVLDAMMADEVARCQANAETLVLKGANHGGPLQRPEAFIEEIMSFVSALQ